jgi:uncharacterized protein DUF664
VTGPKSAGEIPALLRFLQDQRDHVLGILDGLADQALRRAVLPSGWNCLGLLNHLAVDDERFWFRGVIAGEQEVIDEVAEGAHDNWNPGSAVPAEDLFALYRRESKNADVIIANSDLDAPLAWWPEELFGTWRLHSVREIVLHMIAETATHAGHLDTVRELIDGRQWDI